MKRSDGTRFHRTTPAQIAYIVEHWATRTSGEIEAAIGVRSQTVKATASRLKLAKDSEVLRAIRIAVNARRVNRRGGSSRAVFVPLAQPVRPARIKRKSPVTSPLTASRTRDAFAVLAGVKWFGPAMADDLFGNSDRHFTDAEQEAA